MVTIAEDVASTDDAMAFSGGTCGQHQRHTVQLDSVLSESEKSEAKDADGATLKNATLVKGPTNDDRLNPVAIAVFALWVLVTVNSLVDPLKTIYGYFVYLDSNNQNAVWQLTVANHFNNVTSRVCPLSGPFLDCYFELPVYGTGSLAGATCRSYYPTDKGPTQHIGNFFGNCTFPNGQRVDMPDGRTTVTTQWTVQTSSLDRKCLTLLGEGDSFPCDEYITTNGRIINYRVSQTETKKWCKEFGGYYILNLTSGIQEVLVANVSGTSAAFTSIPMTYMQPVFSLEPLLGCPAEVRMGGIATHISTSGWYGDTTAPWSARTTSAAHANDVSQRASSVFVTTTHYAEGDLTQVRTSYKDSYRLGIIAIITYYRASSVYYPILLVYLRQRQPFFRWLRRRNFGLVLHKRERHNLFILLLLTLEALASTEDVVMYCQQVVYGGSSLAQLALKYMSITRIIWPCAFLLLLASRLVEALLGPKRAFAMSEDLFLLGAPVAWIYIPVYVTTQGMSLFQGYRQTGAIISHYANSIFNVYTNQINNLTLYFQLFGYFTIISSAATFLVDVVWHAVTHSSSSLLVSIMSLRTAKEPVDPNAVTSNLHQILIESTHRMAPEIALQMTRAKVPPLMLCESLNLASEGFVCLAYGGIHVVAVSEWGFAHPLENALGHVAVIHDGHRVAFDPNVTIDSLVKLSSRPAWLGIPDLY
ncbi:hypothetical protein SPRG_13933 [Saprolegnia parasitica CBS 223.65]|uniref:Transmembrane protein n=1 Tax=Saprolegnia parasitica (strain CBS 223.65) TaxID=695850 RepID=A0A067BVY1_SAPPC|nr:hypothetical protein SPRG_13933 [Saprolegnia parasitica CBS 223.65]KDO21005.1 hypothetical protein SPRG_13933 [Saprolegnia parasitica CBS 223.65]|eukprot:XP_012208257.1 hypothetical protein SPRG_13933 [Saprolegnia parasitica CBS 223.65]